MTIISLAIIEAAGEGATYKKVCTYVSTSEKMFQVCNIKLRYQNILVVLKNQSLVSAGTTL